MVEKVTTRGELITRLGGQDPELQRLKDSVVNKAKEWRLIRTRHHTAEEENDARWELAKAVARLVEFEEKQ